MHMPHAPKDTMCAVHAPYWARTSYERLTVTHYYRAIGLHLNQPTLTGTNERYTDNIMYSYSMALSQLPLSLSCLLRLEVVEQLWRDGRAAVGEEKEDKEKVKEAL